MKRILMIAALIAVSTAGKAFATAAPPVTIPMTAGVSSQLTLLALVFKCTPTVTVGDKECSVTPEGTAAMDFGTLAAAETGGPLFNQYYYNVLLSAYTSSRKYEITQTASALTDGTNTINPSASVVTTAAADLNNDMVVDPPAGTLKASTGTSFVGTAVPLYTSDNAGKNAAFSAFYALTSGNASTPAANTIPNDQPAGSYTGSTVITLTLL